MRRCCLPRAGRTTVGTAGAQPRRCPRQAANQLRESGGQAELACVYSGHSMCRTSSEQRKQPQCVLLAADAHAYQLHSSGKSVELSHLSDGACSSQSMARCSIVVASTCEHAKALVSTLSMADSRIRRTSSMAASTQSAGGCPACGPSSAADAASVRGTQHKSATSEELRRKHDAPASSLGFSAQAR